MFSIFCHFYILLLLINFADPISVKRIIAISYDAISVVVNEPVDDLDEDSDVGSDDEDADGGSDEGSSEVSCSVTVTTTKSETLFPEES